MDGNLPISSMHHVRCPGCGVRLDVSRIEPFSVIHCPKCNERIGVGGWFEDLLVLEAVGRGDLAVVYRAYDRVRKRIVALKVARPGEHHDPLLPGRLRNEARVLGEIDDTHVVKLLSTAEPDGHLYLELEYLGGGSVRQAVAHRAVMGLHEDAALRIALDVTRGLQAIKRTGHLHRDVIPGNILLDAEGRAKLIDLSSVLLIGDKAPQGALGTPGFVAPEALRHRQLDHRVDIYGLGCTLFYMLTGRPPFEQRLMKASTLLALQQHPPTPEQFGCRVHKQTTDVIGMMLDPSRRSRVHDFDELIGFFEDALWEAEHNRFPQMHKPDRLPDEPDEDDAIKVEGDPISGHPAGPGPVGEMWVP